MPRTVVLLLTAMQCLLVFCTNETLCAQDTIPFTLGTDNRIYIKVTVNDTESLDFIFDTGAASTVINTSQTATKLPLQFNSSVANRGANGITNQPVSAGNTLQIGPFVRKNEDLLGIAYPKQHYSFDGVIGYPFFEDYLIEIDYRYQRMVIHKKRNTVFNLASYEALPMDLSEDVPFVDMLVFKNDTPVTLPVMLDTGFNGELIVYHKMVEKLQLANQFVQRGTSASEGTDGGVIRSNSVIIPKVTMGTIEFADLPAFLNRTPSPTSFTAILGGAVLKQLHWVFDFKKQEVMFKTSLSN